MCRHLRLQGSNSGEDCRAPAFSWLILSAARRRMSEEVAPPRGAASCLQSLTCGPCHIERPPYAGRFYPAAASPSCRENSGFGVTCHRRIGIIMWGSVRAACACFSAAGWSPAVLLGPRASPGNRMRDGRKDIERRAAPLCMWPCRVKDDVLACLPVKKRNTSVTVPTLSTGNTVGGTALLGKADATGGEGNVMLIFQKAVGAAPE